MNDFYYRQNMMDHSKNPRCYGKIENIKPIHVVNRNCGDELDLYVQKDGLNISSILFSATACAIFGNVF